MVTHTYQFFWRGGGGAVQTKMSWRSLLTSQYLR